MWQPRIEIITSQTGVFKSAWIWEVALSSSVILRNIITILRISQNWKTLRLSHAFTVKKRICMNCLCSKFTLLHFPLDFFPRNLTTYKIWILFCRFQTSYMHRLWQEFRPPMQPKSARQTAHAVQERNSRRSNSWKCGPSTHQSTTRSGVFKSVFLHARTKYLQPPFDLRVCRGVSV